jgi:hypothetical protein
MERPVTTSTRSLKIAAAALAAFALTMPAAHAVGDHHTGSIHISYEPPKDAVQKTYDMVKKHNSLELLQEIFSPFKLPEDLYIKMTNCNGVPNAYFFRENGIPTIRVCYEYLNQIYEMMPKEQTADGISPREALVGQLLFAVAHEFGHASFELYNVPVFGRLEDAADEFSTYFLLQFGGERAQRLIWGAAYSYNEFAKLLRDKVKNPRVTLPIASFSSDHGSPEQRFYNLVCIAYGYDPKTFAAVVEKGYLPEARAKVCNNEYAILEYAVQTLIMPHVDEAQSKRVLATTVFPSDWENGEYFP